MDRRFEGPKPLPASSLLSVATGPKCEQEEKGGLLPDHLDGTDANIVAGQSERPPILYASPEEMDEGGRTSWRRLGAQYGVPLCFPLAFALLVSTCIYLSQARW